MTKLRIGVVTRANLRLFTVISGGAGFDTKREGWKALERYLDRLNNKVVGEG